MNLSFSRIALAAVLLTSVSFSSAVFADGKLKIGGSLGTSSADPGSYCATSDADCYEKAAQARGEAL